MEVKKRFLTTPELAAWLHVSPRTVEGWRLGRKAHLDPPAFLRLSHRCVRYDLDEVVSWLTDCHMDASQRERARRVCMYPPGGGASQRPPTAAELPEENSAAKSMIDADKQVAPAQPAVDADPVREKRRRNRVQRRSVPYTA